MMASFAADLDRLTAVLRSNAVEKSVDPGMLQALLELYASDEQRVDMVLLDIQGMLGKELRIGAQQERWNEIQNVDGMRIEYEHLIPRPAQRQDEADVMILPRAHINDPPLAAGNGPEEPAARITHVDLTKRKIAVRDVENLQQNLKKATAVKTVVSNAASTSNSQTNQQRQIIQPKRTVSTNPNTAPPNHTPAVIPRKSGPANATATLQIPQAQGIPVVVLAKPPEKTVIIPLTKESNETSTTPQEREATAVELLKLLVATIPLLHVKFAAFKAAEFATLKNSEQHFDNFKQLLRNQPDQVIKANQEWDPPETENAEQQRLFQHIYEEFINEQLDFFVRILPEADPEFLEVQIRGLNCDQERIRSLVTQFIEGEMAYPSRADYNKRKEYNDLANKFFTVEEFLDLYEDPFKHFGDETRATDPDYRDEALNQLKLDFRRAGLATLRKLFNKHNFHYWPTYQEVSNSPRISEERKTIRSLNECKQFKTKNLFLIQEVAFIRLQAEVETYMKNKEQMRLDAVSMARQNNALLECPICCEEELVELDMAMCPSGHGACRNCVRRHAEELIGMMKNHVPCLEPGCKTEYGLDVLKEALGKPTYNRLEKRLQAEEIMAAGIEGLESCPFCDYAQVPRDTDKLFECQNPECQRVSCRACREANHLPLRCEEHAMKQRLSNYVEAKMTEALLRECPSCKTKFVKSDGCNKMTCVKCGVLMCYVCRQQIRGYDHFANHQPHPTLPGQVLPIPKGKCPLYSDTKKMHDEEVAKSAEQAKAELAKSNPNIRVDLVLGRGKT